MSRSAPSNESHRRTWKNTIIAMVAFILIGSLLLFLRKPHEVSTDEQQPRVLSLSQLDGANGVAFHSQDMGDSAGRSTSAAGDINADGIDDIIIGAVKNGRHYVVFGSRDRFDPIVQLSSLDGNNGFVIEVDHNFMVMNDVSDAIGDFNGDGIDDIAIGVDHVDVNGVHGAGSVYVIYGSSSGFPASIHASSIDGSNGLIIEGAHFNSAAGHSVSAAGDLNADGRDDLAISAIGERYISGAVYVVFGFEGHMASPLSLADLDGTNGLRIVTEESSSRLGWNLDSVGDFNGDNIDDLLIRTNRLGDRVDATESVAFILFGSHTPFSAELSITDLNGDNGIVFNGLTDGNSGSGVTNAGDFNGDGINDLAIGSEYTASGDRRNTGSTYLVFGSTRQFERSFDLSSLSGRLGFRFDGVNASGYSGRNIAGVGDLNRDGFDDLAIGNSVRERMASDDFSSVYILYGSQDIQDKPINPMTMSGANLTVIRAESDSDEAGFSANSAGDFNGDGIEDLLIGAPNANSSGKFASGRAYVLFGGSSLFTEDIKTNDSPSDRIPLN